MMSFDDAIVDFTMIAHDIEHMRCARHTRRMCEHRMLIDDDDTQRVIINRRIVRRAQRA